MNRLAILHYHLNRGGVTQVIINQLRALDRALSRDERLTVTLIYGGRKAAWPDALAAELKNVDLSLVALPALDYDEDRPQDARLGEQLADVLNAGGMKPSETIVHVHNHGLGKNVDLPGALRHLASAGFALLLQIHDFAEDFRPENYGRLRDAWSCDARAIAARLYPQAPHIHYAVLNDRDRSILCEAGIPADRAHLLPNAVAAFEQLPDKRSARSWLASRFGVAEEELYLLYPVRCIRRKNIGEALAWLLFNGPKRKVGFTLPPLNPSELAGYNRCKSLAAELDLGCVFEVGADRGLSFAENLASADLLLTTSVAEGFGMVFLESWLADRPLVGRDLPEVTGDFVRHGLRMEGLGKRLDVPIDWIGRDAFAEMLGSALEVVSTAYDIAPLSDRQLRGAVESKIERQFLDFGDLNSAMQERVLRLAANSAAKQDQLTEANPCIAAALSQDPASQVDLVASNARAVERTYSLGPRGEALLELYRLVDTALRDEPIEPLEHGERILERFLDPTRLRPIRLDS